MFDTILTNGLVMDGTGTPGIRQDVGIQGETIAALGNLSNAQGGTRIDLSGCVVAPGFIDIHDHADGSIEKIPQAENFLRQGITTCIGGNCGGTAFPIGEALDRVAQLDIRTNYAVLVGCNTSRGKVLGEERPATDDEIGKMQDWVRRGFEEGALGLSSGVRYLPFLTTRELVEMSKVAADFDSFYVSHIRDEGKGLLDAIDELIEVVRQSGAAGQVSHIKCYGRAVWGQAQQVLERIDRACERDGLDITADQYPYTGSHTGLAGVLFGQDTKIRASRQGGLKTLLDNDLRKHAEPHFHEVLERLDAGRGIILTAVKSAPKLSGKTLADYLEARDGNPYETTVALCVEDSPSAIYLAMCEEDVRTYMKSPRVMVGTDGNLQKSDGGYSHPRNFGTFPRVLARYVREQGLIGLEEAVHKMTGMPARRLGFRKRGRIAKGMTADITVFNPKTIEDTANFEAPRTHSKGIELVLVAGKVALKHDTPIAAGYGRVIRLGEG